MLALPSERKENSMKLIIAVLLLTAFAGSLGAGSCLNTCYAELRACKKLCPKKDSPCFMACFAAYNTCTSGCPQ